MNCWPRRREGKNSRIWEKTYLGSENCKKSKLTVDKQRSEAERQAQKIPAGKNAGEAYVLGCVFWLENKVWNKILSLYYMGFDDALKRVKHRNYHCSPV